VNLREWNETELKKIRSESLSKENRYFFWKKYHREAYNNDELELFYVLEGGGFKFHKEHENERDDI